MGTFSILWRVLYAICGVAFFIGWVASLFGWAPSPQTVNASVLWAVWVICADRALDSRLGRL